MVQKKPNLTDLNYFDKQRVERMASVSIDSLFHDIYGTSLEKYKFSIGEKLKLIKQYIHRLETDSATARAGINRLHKELMQAKQMRLL